MFALILGVLVLVGTVIAGILIPKQFPQVKRWMIFGVGIVISVLLIVPSFIVTLEPGQIGVAYNLNGSKSNLTVGYNFIPPWARINRWDTTIKVMTFSQGEADNDIYGAQTNEKDYIEAVSTMSVRIDTDRIDEYVTLYGNEQVDSARISQMFKTISRESIESTINVKSTAEVMSAKKQVSDEAKAYLEAQIADLPIILVSFTVDDLVAPEAYENAIKEQAQLRMNKTNATLQQEINEQEAQAAKVKAQGEADVKKIQAEADAQVKEIEAKNAAAIATVKAQNEAEVKKIQAEAEADVRRTKAEAEATEITTKATAEAEAIVKQGEAEAKAIEAQGNAYKQNPQLIELKMAEIKAEVDKAWAEKWSGFSFEGMSGFNFADLTEIFKGIIPGAPAVTAD